MFQAGTIFLLQRRVAPDLCSLLELFVGRVYNVFVSNTALVERASNPKDFQGNLFCVAGL